MGKSSEILRKAREAGGIGGGQERAKNMKPLMDDIVGRPYEWASDQCARFFEALLRKYVEQDYLEQLLADSGFGAEYENIKTISKRHDYLIAKYPEKYRFDKTTLRKRGTGQLDRIAEVLERDRENGFVQAKQLLASVLTDAELEELRRAGIVLPVASEKSNVNLRRTERISNIGEPDGLFVGRADLLGEIEAGFKAGFQIQFIGGGDGWGKSRVAFEYAQHHAAKYQIICWLNAWDEICITGDIVSFLNQAKVPYDDALPDRLAEVFCRFFEANTDWLIVFDNTDLKLSLQQEMLKKYMPSGEGHIIVTGNFGEQSGFKGSKYHLLDCLGKSAPDASLKQIADLCGGQPLPMTLISSYIRESGWVDATTYLHMLEERGIGAEKSTASRIDEAAFEIKMGALGIRRRYYGDLISLAVQQFLMISSICNHADLDLTLLGGVMSVFPEPLAEICMDQEGRGRLIDALKGFGLYEIREGVLHSNIWLNTLSHQYFSAAEQSGLCAHMLDRMERSIVLIRENRYAGNADTLTALIKPLADQALLFMHFFGNLSDDEVAQRYPNVTKTR